MAQEKIQHFGVWIAKSEKNKISRENYAVIDKKNSTWFKGLPFLYQKAEDRQKYYDDEECRIRSDSFCAEWQEKCLINFDKNMAFLLKFQKKDLKKNCKS